MEGIEDKLRKYMEEMKYGTAGKEYEIAVRRQCAFGAIDFAVQAGLIDLDTYKRLIREMKMEFNKA